MRSEVLGDLTFVDHAEIPLDSKYKLMFLIIYDGATQLMTSFPCTTKSESETIDLLLDYFDLYQLSPKYIVGDQGFSGTELESFYNRKGNRFIALGPQTPWPNRAEAAVRLFKQQVRLTLDGVRADPKCNPFTFGNAFENGILDKTLNGNLLEVSHHLRWNLEEDHLIS